MSIFDPVQRTETLSAQITLALYRIGQALQHILRARGEQLGLSPAQVQALLFLLYARPGVRTIGGLAERLAVTYATASGVADALENKELLRRHALPEDRRVITLSLTGKGRELAASLDDVLGEVETIIATLSETEQNMLRSTLQKVVRRLQVAGHIRIYEMCWGCQFFRPHAHPDHPAGPHHCAFVDAPLSEEYSRLECPDFIPKAA